MDDKPQCSQFCDPPSSRLMDQAIAKFSERSAFANSAAMDTYNQMSPMVLSEANNIAQMHGMAAAILMMSAVENA